MWGYTFHYQLTNYSSNAEEYFGMHLAASVRVAL